MLIVFPQIGCAAGSLGSLLIGDRAGRKFMIIMGGSTMIIGTAILASSTTLAQLLLGRIVTGIVSSKYFDSSLVKGTN
jgi:MFS family permease